MGVEEMERREEDGEARRDAAEESDVRRRKYDSELGEQMSSSNAGTSWGNPVEWYVGCGTYCRLWM